MDSLFLAEMKKYVESQHKRGIPYIGEVENVHLPKEGHDFGPNKRQTVYDFFARIFSLDITKADESKVTIEPAETFVIQ